MADVRLDMNWISFADYRSNIKYPLGESALAVLLKGCLPRWIVGRADGKSRPHHRRHYRIRMCHLSPIPPLRECQLASRLVGTTNLESRSNRSSKNCRTRRMPTVLWTWKSISVWPLTKKTRNLLQRNVTACRRVFDREFTTQLQEFYGIEPDGTLPPL